MDSRFRGNDDLDNEDGTYLQDGLHLLLSMRLM